MSTRIRARGNGGGDDNEFFLEKLKKDRRSENASSVEWDWKEKLRGGRAISKALPLHALVGLRKTLVHNVDFKLHH